MKRLLLVVFITAAAGISVSAQSKGKTDDGMRKAIENASRKFNETYNKGDAVGLAAMYASGARVLPPNAVAILNDQGILDMWRSFINSGAKFSIATTFVEGRGDLAYEVGTYAITAADGGQDTGKFVVVWKRQNGAWKIAADIWNSDLPAAK
jgi:ketosteroid isomerase-like protein